MTAPPAHAASPSLGPSTAGGLQRIRIVLVGASHPGNIGAAARAMKVMGLTDLALVTPRFADAVSHADAIAFASGAGDVLGRAAIHPTLDVALAGVSHAIALTARDRAFAPPALHLRDAANDAMARMRDLQARVAFVFGSERYGLSNEDVLRCQACCRIATARDYGSLNLAQAVQLVAYECRLAADEPDAPAAHGATPMPALASHDEREALIDHLEQGLVAIGYLDPATPKKLMPRLRRLFARAGLERDEVQWLRGIAKAMLHAKTDRSEQST